MRYTVAELFNLWKRNEITEPIKVGGWIEFKRENGDNFYFLVIRDGSSFKTVQAVCNLPTFKREEEFKSLGHAPRGSSVLLKGKLVKSPSKGQDFELEVISSKVLGLVDESYPLLKARLPLENLRNIPHLRMRTKTFQAVGIIRNTLQFETHKFFNKLGFIQVATPLITSNDCEGAGETFDVVKGKSNFFGSDAHLTVSGQLHVETFAHAFEKVYTFGPTFRAENSNTSRHLAEFWMIEPEMSFITFHELMNNMEMYLKYVCSKILTEHRDILEFFEQYYEKGLIQRLEGVAKIGESFFRKKYDDCLKFLLKEIECGNIVIDKETKRLENGTLVLNKIPVFGDDFGSEIEKYLVEEFGNKPFFITHFPKKLKSFYMKVDENPLLVEACDLLVPGVGELMGGSMREENLEKLRDTMKEKNVAEEGLEWYIDMRKYGTVPHGGYGVGFERLICYVTGMKNIRDVIPFFRAPGQCFA